MSSRGHDDDTRRRANRYLWIIVPIAIAGMVGGILWGELRTPQYRSSALISVGNPLDSMSQEALRATSSTVLEPATAILGFAPDVSVDANENARLLTVTAVASNAEDAALSATTVASTYVDTQLGSASQVVAEGDLPTDPFAPNRQASLLFGSGLGAALGLLTALFMQRQVPNLEAKLDEERRRESPEPERPRMAQPDGVRLQDRPPENRRESLHRAESAPDESRSDRVRARRERATAAPDMIQAIDPLHQSEPPSETPTAPSRSSETRATARPAERPARDTPVTGATPQSFASEARADRPRPERPSAGDIPGVGYPRYQPSALSVSTPSADSDDSPASASEPTAGKRSLWNDTDLSTEPAALTDDAAASPQPVPAALKDDGPASPRPDPAALADDAAALPQPDQSDAEVAAPPGAEPIIDVSPEPVASTSPTPVIEPSAETASAPAAMATSVAASTPQLINEAVELEREQARLERAAQRSRHELAISSLNTTHRKEIGELTSAFAKERVELRQEIEEAARIRTTSFSSRATLDQSRVTDLEEQVAALEEDRSELRNQLERQRIDSESRLSDEQARFDRSLDNARRDFRSELARHNQSQRTTIEELRQELDQALLAQRQEHETQLAAQHDEYTAALEAERAKRDEALELAQSHLRSELKRQKDHEQQELRQQAESQRETIATLRQMVDQSSKEADEHGLAAQKLRVQVKDHQRSARHAAETAATQIENLRDELNAQIRVTQAERERSDGLLADLRRVNEEQSAEADRALAERTRHLAELRQSVERQRKYADDRVREISASAEERARDAAQREAELRASISRLERAQANKTTS